jgi:hypothetical protein
MSRWQSLTGRELLAQAWWRPLPGIVIGAVVLSVIASPLVGAIVGIAAWAVTIVFNVLLVVDKPARLRRRPWH